MFTASRNRLRIVEAAQPPLAARGERRGGLATKFSPRPNRHRTSLQNEKPGPTQAPFPKASRAEGPAQPRPGEPRLYLAQNFAQVEDGRGHQRRGHGGRWPEGGRAARARRKGSQGGKSGTASSALLRVLPPLLCRHAALCLRPAARFPPPRCLNSIYKVCKLPARPGEELAAPCQPGKEEEEGDD